jgi:DNA-binding GntR family transcriptional regulator/transposase
MCCADNTALDICAKFDGLNGKFVYPWVMVHHALEITDGERAALTTLAVSRRTPQGESTRARIVLACAEGTLAGAARRCGVSVRTAAKWRQRFQRSGIAGLADAPRSGRPATTDELVGRALMCTLKIPPARSWSTRLVADATGLSQATVCRIRQDHFPKTAIEAGPKLAEQSAFLAFVHVDPDRRVLAFHSQPTTPDRYRRRPSTTRQIADTIETVLCAALVSDTAPRLTTPSPRSATAIDLLRRAAENTPAGWSVTVVLDFEPDDKARNWLRRNPNIDIVVVAPECWLRQLHSLTVAIDTRQLPELFDLQRRIRQHYVGVGQEFEWSRRVEIFETDTDAEHSGGGLRAERRPSESTLVIRGLYQAMADGELYAGRRISERALATRMQLSSGVVSEALRHLADDGLINQDDTGRFFVPAPTERDVLETYTARGLLGTAIVRRLASQARPLPAVVDDVFKELVWCAGREDIAVTNSMDLDVQDELARAAGMPRFEGMFIRLTLQLRLFITILGLSYQYPIDGIISDNTHILDAIRARDPDSAVAAWRSKIDKAARFMMLHLSETPTSRN